MSLAAKFAIVACLTGLAGAVPCVMAQSPLPNYSGDQRSSQTAFSQQELDQMLAPIALYPDALLAQVLMAATHPLQVLEAARWSRAHPYLKGEQAVDAVAREAWDMSVKSLVAFPELIAMMDERLDWMKRLGEAYLEQEPHVMDTIQTLRQRAHDAGNLRSSDAIRLTQQDQALVIASADPRVVYVPDYDPLFVYGTWWWPAPPVRWVISSGSYWRPGTTVVARHGRGAAARVVSGRLDWRHRQAAVPPSRLPQPHPSPRPRPQVRDGASLQINPHLGPRDHRGQLRDGASMLINPHAAPAHSDRRLPRGNDVGNGVGFINPRRTDSRPASQMGPQDRQGSRGDARHGPGSGNRQGGGSISPR